MKNNKLLMLMEIAIFAALGIVLDKLSFSIWAQGGSISFVMIPIILMAVRWGLFAGCVTGLLIGVLQVMFGGYIVHWLQALLDYGFAFTVVGLAALWRKPILNAAQSLNRKKLATWIVIATIIGGTLRYACHTIAGAVFFAEYAGDQNAWVYSTIYNGSYMIPATILTAIFASFLFTSAPRLLKR